MTIEQEFFKAFGVEPELNCKNCHKYNDGESLYGDKGGCYDGSKETKKCYSLYPPITPEIVLNLEEIILDKYIDSLLLTKIKDRTFEYRIGYSNHWNNVTQADTRYKALLKMCIQLKDEIQDQVKALFNA